MTLSPRQRLALLVLLAVGLALRAYRLDFPDHQYFDEIYYVPAANNYLDAQPDQNNLHPPLAKLVIAAGMLLLDGLKAYGLNTLPDQVAWRFSGCLAGLGTLIVSYLLALYLTGSPRTGILTVFLLTFDFLQLVESRIATLDMIQCFFSTAGLAACAHAFMVRFRPRTVWLAGLCFGAATACKWNGLLVPVGVMAWLLWARLPGLSKRRPARHRPSAAAAREPWRSAHPLRVGAIFAVAVAAVYLASYTPLFLREGSVGPAAFREIWGFHTRMWNFHYDPHQFRHRYLSQFYEWPLVLRPVWFYYEQPGDRVEGIVAMGSPLFWWLAVLLLVDQALFGWRRPDRAGPFLLLGYLSTWLLWCLSTTGGFLYYMLPSTPMMAALVARELADWWEEPLSRALAIFYLVTVVLVFALYFPLLTGLPVSQGYHHVLFLYWGWV